ncbi:hypothetical protein M9Y10_029496 [Tritrichomonas musculus]|uniref:Uncharacterized protein n=1 Tax=Tritrichomonas musculus TaxID=1915356 RepID=A0ABR2KMH8_9EUKA
MSNNEDEDRIVHEIVHELLSDNNYDPKTIPKQYLPKIHGVLMATKHDAIARGQLPVVKRIQSILASLPETVIINNGYTSSLLDQKNKKRAFHPASQLKEKRTPRYNSKDSRSAFDSQTTSSRFYRPRTALQKSNRNNNNRPNSNIINKNTRPISKLSDNNSRCSDELNAIDFETDAYFEKNNRAVRSSPPTAKIQATKRLNPKRRLYTDEQLDVALENMVNGNSFIPKSDVLPELIDYAKRKIDNLIKNGELITAQKYEDVYQQMQSSKQAWEGCNTKSLKLNELTNQMNKADKSLQNAEENMEKELREYDERMDAIREAQLKEFEKQLYEFDKETNFRVLERSGDENSQSKSNLSTSRSSVNQSNSQNLNDDFENSIDQSNSENSKDTEISSGQINSESSKTQSISPDKSKSDKSKIYPNLPPSFRKFSQRLLDLREREKLLLKTRRFEEAGYVRMEADNLEAREIQQCKINYLKSREDKKAKIIEEQKQKMKCFEENGARIRKRLQTENEVRISALKRAKENFQGRIGRLDVEIKDTLSTTPAPSPLQSRPMSPPRSPDSYSQPTFMTQQQQLTQRQQKNQQKSEDSQVEEKNKPAKKRITTTMAPPHIVYRPIPSKWRLQTPQIIKMNK